MGNACRMRAVCRWWNKEFREKLQIDFAEITA
jgi:hypothetical protein